MEDLNGSRSGYGMFSDKDKAAAMHMVLSDFQRKMLFMGIDCDLLFRVYPNRKEYEFKVRINDSYHSPVETFNTSLHSMSDVKDRLIYIENKINK